MDRSVGLDKRGMGLGMEVGILTRPTALFLREREAPMPIILSEWATSQEISNRIDRLRMQYAGNPLVKRIDHHIGVDWSDDPAVFIDVILPGNEIAAAEF
jgi:hypothetical protein